MWVVSDTIHHTRGEDVQLDTTDEWQSGGQGQEPSSDRVWKGNAKKKGYPQKRNDP